MDAVERWFVVRTKYDSGRGCLGMRRGKRKKRREEEEEEKER